MLTAPLESSVTRLDEELRQGALNIFILVHVALILCRETPESSYLLNVVLGRFNIFN